MWQSSSFIGSNEEDTLWTLLPLWPFVLKYRLSIKVSEVSNLWLSYILGKKNVKEKKFLEMATTKKSLKRPNYQVFMCPGVWRVEEL